MTYLKTSPRYARIGCWLQVANTFVTVSVTPIFLPEYAYAVWFLVVPILFAEVLLGEFEAVLVGVLSIGVLGFYQSGVFPGVEVKWMQYVCLFLVSGTVLLSRQRRNLVSRDETYRRDEKEHHQRQLLNVTFDGTAMIRDGMIVEANDAFSRLLDVSSKELVGKSIELYIEPVDTSVNLANVGLGFERVLMHKSTGEAIQAERIVAEFDREGELMQVVAIRDLSEPIRLQEQLQHTRRLASVGHLAATVAHEINNPLAVIQLRLDLLRAVTSDEIQQGHLTIVAEHIVRISHIVRNLRSFSRPNKGNWHSIPLLPVLTNATLSI